jgi:hypothetical protein
MASTGKIDAADSGFGSLSVHFGGRFEWTAGSPPFVPLQNLRLLNL